MYESRTKNHFADELEDILTRNEYNDNGANPIQGKTAVVHGKTKEHISTPAIAGIIVFIIVTISAACMFFFYRRRRSRNKSGKGAKDPRRSSSQVVRLSPVAVTTSTHKLTSQTSPRPIPAAPDYHSQGVRRLSRGVINADTTSSEEEQYFDADEVVQRYDWSSSSRASTWKKKEPVKEPEEDEYEATILVETPSDEEDEVDAIANHETEKGYPENHIGRIWFQIDYQSTTEKLNVTVFKVRNLPLRESSNSPPDPQVRLYLLPDDRCQHQTETKRKTCNPNFGDSFNFQVARDHLRQRSLRLSVFDQGRGRRGDVIGHVLYSLKDQEFGEETWRDLETLSEVESTLGDLHVSLAYYPVLDRLTVIVLRAANLPRRKGRTDLDTYVKVTFSKGNNILKMKKTSVKYDTTEPFYNESFNISTTVDDLPSCSLLLSVYQNTENDDEDGKLIGRVLLGGMMYARGKELEHWTEMTCQPRVMIKYWHPLSK